MSRKLNTGITSPPKHPPNRINKNNKGKARFYGNNIGEDQLGWQQRVQNNISREE
jgi:hypothetical protein